MERALGRRAVAEERDRHAAVGAELGGGRGAHGDRQAGGDDAVGAEDPEVGVGDVHRAAAPAVRALVLAHQLGEHPERVEALGQAVAVAAVGRRDDVGRAQRPARPDRRGLLSDREVHEAGHLAVAVERGHPLLEPADHAASAGASRRGRRSRGAAGAGRPGVTNDVLYWSVQRREGAMTDQIEIPESFPEPGRRRRQAGRDHRRRPRPRHAARPRLLPGRRLGGARGPHREGPQGGRRRAARARRSCSAATSPTRTSTRRWPTPPSPSGAALDVWICNAGISPIVAGPARHRRRRSGGRCSR